MRRFFTIFFAGLVCTAIGAGFAGAGPIRDLLKNLKEKRNGAETSAVLQPVTISFQGVDRTFYVYVPQSAVGAANVPAVMVFHGGGGDAAGVATSSDMIDVAQALGFVAIFPEVISGQWNDGRSVSAGSYDDVGFVRAIIGNAEGLIGVDLGRVFAAGISNGGMFTQRLSCDAADLFSAVAVISANMPDEYQSACNPSRSVPKVFFNGTDDPIMPWSGGEIKSLKALGFGAGGSVMSHQQTQEFWLAQDGCSAAGSTRSLPDSANDGTTVSLQSFTNCSGSTQLSFYEIEGGGHSWPGSSERARRMAGTISQDVSATAEMIGFFQGYGL
jgi:polyhydroxybutyrate depolymerase